MTSEYIEEDPNPETDDCPTHGEQPVVNDYYGEHHIIILACGHHVLSVPGENNTIVGGK